MKRPLACLVSIFCAGIIFLNFIYLSFLWAYLLSAIFLILCFLTRRQGLKFDIFLLCFVFLLGSLFLINSKILPKHHISNYISYKDKKPKTIKGHIYNDPVFKNEKTSFIFIAQELIFNKLKLNCCGKLLVQIRGKKALDYGQELIINGSLCRPFNFSKNKGSSYRSYLNKKGIYAMMYIKGPAGITILNKNKGFFLKGLCLRLKMKIKEMIFKYLSILPAKMLSAMMLGDKEIIPPSVRNAMVKSGTVHILVVSGFHVGLVAFMVIIFLKLLRLPRQIRFPIAIFSLLVYCLMTGASTSIVRATIMAIFFMFGFLIKREPDIFNSCALAAILILLFNPQQLFDIGFQLSFASVLSILYVYPKLKSLLHTDGLKIRVFRYLTNAGLVSLSAWIGTMGFIAYYFKIFSPVTILANLFIIPLASLAILCGFSLIFISFVAPPFVPFFAATTELVVALLLRTNALLIKIPYAHFYLRGLTNAHPCAKVMLLCGINY